MIKAKENKGRYYAVLPLYERWVHILALHDKKMKTFKERLAAHYKNIIFLQVVFGT